MKKTLMFAAALTLAACGGKPAARPAVAKVGELAPELKLEKVLQGDPKAVASWQALKGKAVVLEFWATYCDPCVDNIPHLNDLAEKFKDQPVVFLSVSKEPAATVTEFLKTHELKGVVAADAAEASKNFAVRGVPKTVLIDKDGRVAAVTYPTQVGAKTIEALLAGKDPSGVKNDELTALMTGSESYFAVAPSINGRSGTSSASEMKFDGFPLSENIESVLSAVHLVEYRDVDKELLAKKYSLVVKVPKDAAGDGTVLRDFAVAGLNTAFPLKISVVKKARKVYLLKKAGAAGPGLKETDKQGGGYGVATSKDGIKLNADAAKMTDLAKTLEEHLKVPVLDETGLDGKRYAYELALYPATVASARAALEAQLGLKLVEVRREIPVGEVVGVKKKI